MKPIRSYLGAILALLAVLSCSHDTYNDDTFPGKQDQTGQVALRITTDTKSVLPSTLETAVKTLLVVLCRDDDPSQWKSLYQQGDAPVTVSLQLNQAYTAYAFVNMGNVLPDIPRAEGGALDFPAFSYTISSYEQLKEEGFPMAGKLAIPGDRLLSRSSFTIAVDRLMAKVQVNVDGVSMDEGCVYMRNVANTVYPFAAVADRRARSRAQIFDGNTDWEAFQGAEGMNGRSQTLVFYVPENCQGQLLSTQMQWQKSADYMDDQEASLCTYLEFQAQKDGAQDGVSGPVTYRCFLGENTANDFSVARNGVYLAQLSLSWDGLFSGQTWRIDAENLADNRRLRLSTQSRTLEANLSSLGNVRRENAVSLYVNFSRDRGTSWVEGAKDINEWPFGWNLYVDGVLQPSGAASTAAGDIGWSYSSTGDLLTIQPGPAAVTGKTHTLQVLSADGRVASNVVSFTVGENPLVGIWKDDTAPRYVAQRGQIQCYDPDSGELFTDAAVHSTDASKISVTDHGDGTADISILAPFEVGEAGIYLTDQDGERRCDVDLEGLLPYWCFSNQDAAETYVDGQFSKLVVFSRSAATQGTELIQNRFKLSNGTYATGEYLNYSLVLSCLHPTVTCENGFIGLNSLSYSESGMTVTMSLKTFQGLSFDTAAQKVIDTIHVVGTALGDLAATVSAWNPFVDYTALRVGSVMNDYTLFRFPGNDYGWDASAYWSARTYTDSQSYSMAVPRILVENDAHTRLKAYFHDDGRAFGTAMLSGAPSRYSPTSMTYSLSGVKETDIINHGAGQVDFNIDVVCPVDGSVLTRTFGYGYVRLHAFIYGEVYWTRSGQFLTAPNILHGNAIANGKGLFPETLYLHVASTISAPTWPYITAVDGTDPDGEVLNMTRAIMEQDAGGGSLCLYPELDSSLPGWVGQNAHGEECYWYLPEQMRQVSSNKQAEFLKACVRRSVLPYTFSSSHSSIAGKEAFYRHSETELHYDPTWGGAYTYSLPTWIESSAAARRLLVLHIVRGTTETYNSYLGYYDAAPEGGNGGWYFSYENRTAFWR